MKVLVIGVGATGGLFAARFASSGHAVTVIGRPAAVRSIRADGLVVEDRTRMSVRVVAATTIPREGPFDLALLTVKTFDVGRASADLARSRPDPLPTLLPQNGLGIETVARASAVDAGWKDPGPWLVRAVHSIPATLLAPGRVRVGGEGELLLPGAGPARVAADRFEELFRSAGFRVRRVPEFEREVWRKALVNAAINPLSAVRGVPNGRLLEEPWRSEALALLGEAVAAAAAAGHRFSEEEARSDFERVATATATNRSSMLQDLERGRPTEIEAISGALLEVGREHGLDLPATRAVRDELLRRTAGRARPPQRS